MIGGDKIAKVSIVGVGMRSHAGIASKMFRVLAEEGINIQMISTSEIKISVLIDADYTEVIRLIKLADSKTIDVRQTALEHSWKNCSQKIDTLFQK